MKYFCICPEVAGGMGKHTVFGQNAKSDAVQKLHYEFQGWDGDYLLTTSPCFIVAVPLSERIRNAGLTGYSFDAVEISLSSQFRIFKKGVKLPEFVWLKVEGQPEKDDFGVGELNRLIVSERALAVIRECPLSHCDIYDVDKAPSSEDRQRQIVEDAYRKLGCKPPDSWTKKYGKQ